VTKGGRGDRQASKLGIGSNPTDRRMLVDGAG
jgi:hypothetical protein